MKMHRLMPHACISVAAVCVLFGTSARAGAPGRPDPQPGGSQAGDVAFLDYIEMTGLMDPSSEDFLLRRISAAERARSTALVVRVDSPGAVGISAVRMAAAVRDAKVPMVVWVAPGEARAHSIAAYMLAAADISVMASNSTVGPASAELVVNSKTPASGRVAEKQTLSSILRTGMHERDAAALERHPLSAARAQQVGLVDFRAASLQQLLEGLGGRSAEVAEEVRTLPAGGFSPRFHKMPLFGRLLHGAVRPPAAYLLLLGAIFLLLFELYNPGIGGAAVSGGISAGFSLYGFAVLPSNWAGVLLLLAGLALWSVDLQASRLGFLTAAGGAALLAGSLVVFAGRPPGMQLPPWAILGGLAATVAFYFGVMPAAVRSRVARPLAGAENIVGTRGVARTDVAPEGQVMARGTLWRARTLGAAIPHGAQVEIKGVAGLILMVEQAAPQAPEPEHPPAGA